MADSGSSSSMLTCAPSERPRDLASSDGSSIAERAPGEVRDGVPLHAT